MSARRLFTTTIRRQDRRTGAWYDEPTIRASEAREMIAEGQARGLVGLSRVNPSLSRGQAATILGDSIRDVPDTGPIHPLIAKNVLREFGRGSR